jgi:monofunctional glycosyltransferase
MYRTRRRPLPLVGRLMRAALLLLLVLAVLPLILTAAYRVVSVPGTPLMLIRWGEGYRSTPTSWGWQHAWVPLDNISPKLARAVIAAEDNQFCSHDGFDWEAIEEAVTYNNQPRNIKRGRKKGASTISQQVAKNLFLWPGRSWVRKGLEVPLTTWVETTLPKRRILEIYLNSVEWAPGVYGAEAASRYYFNTSARKLTTRQASLLAAILPKPLGWSAAKPSGFVNFRANRIQKRLPTLGGWNEPLLACLEIKG